MKTKIIKFVSILLCAAVLLGGTGAAVYALGFAKAEGNSKAAEASLEGTEITSKTKSGAETAVKAAKDETVYVFMNSEGSVRKIIVGDWIKNKVSADKIYDVSELSAVENTKGGETRISGDGNGYIWNANGCDIHYRGNIEKELPISVSVSYKLDGKSILPAELSGKSGKVSIRFDYETLIYETTEINGRQEKIHVPFVMLTGLLLDNAVFTNIEVTNGKLISDGDRSMVMCVAFPELQNDLNIRKEKLNIPDYAEITADVKNFEITNTVTVASNEVFNEESRDWNSVVYELTAPLNELSGAAEQLSDGAEQLYNGLSELLENTNGFENGIGNLAKGSNNLKSGAEALTGGVSELADGTKNLADGLSVLDANSDSLTDGAKQTFDTMLNAANAQLAAAGFSVPKLTVENYTEILNGLIAALGEENAQPVIDLKSRLDDYNRFYMGLKQYISGVAQAKDGAERASSGAERLKTGFTELLGGIYKLHGGILALKKSVPALTAGITQLHDGALQLSDGFKEFDKKGIQKLVDASDDAAELAERLNALKTASEHFVSFSGISETMTGCVRFICRTDSISIAD